MQVNIKLLHEKAYIPFKTYDSDFCYDCIAVSEEEVAPNVWKYGLGFSLQIERGIEQIRTYDMYRQSHGVAVDLNMSDVRLSFSLRPRSSVWKTGMVLSNSIGTVDEGYIGEVSAVFYHVMPNMPRYKVGDKICQIMISATLPIEFNVVKELKETDRGTGGYGSTDKQSR